MGKKERCEGGAFYATFIILLAHDYLGLDILVTSI
jgi:hypothetical protein